MAQAFTRDPSDDARIVGFLDDVERSLVIELMHQTSVLLSDGVDEPAAGEDIFAALERSMQRREAPIDPALRRLLPDGVKGDEEAASEFRRLTESSLRERKVKNLDVAMKALERGFVDDEQSAAIADGVYDAATDPAVAAEPGPNKPDGTLTPDGLDDGTREIVLTEWEARAMMMALADVRLVLAERLGLHTDEDAEELHERLEHLDAPSSSEELIAAYYDFLTWMSESVTLALTRQE